MSAFDSYLEKLRSKEWRLDHLYSIVDKRAQKIRFRRNAIQQRISAIRGRKQVLKARQFGVSTGEIIDIFDDTIWKENQTNAIVAHEKDSIVKLFRIVRRAYDFLPDEAKPVLDRGDGSKYELFFPEINSRIYCDLEIRSDTVSRLHVSEAAFFREPEKLLATLQAVPVWCPVTLESTPNGLDPLFYEWWNDPLSPYAKLFFPWYIFQEYAIAPGVAPREWSAEEKALAKKAAKHGVVLSPEQVAFRRTKKYELRHLFIQEYPEDDQTCFLSSGNAAFDLVLVKGLLDAAPKPAALHQGGAFTVYRERERGKRYAIGCDTAEGTGGDFNVAQVFEVGSREQVACLRTNRRKPSDFAHMIAEAAEVYKQPGERLPLVGVERNNHGHATLLELHEHIGYPNLYRGRDEKLGWLTDRVSRPVMLDVLIQGVENGSVKLNDATTLRECLTLVSNGGKIEAGTGKNDDTVMAAAIAVQLCIDEGASSVYDGIDAKILL